MAKFRLRDRVTVFGTGSAFDGKSGTVLQINHMSSSRNRYDISFDHDPSRTCWFAENFLVAEVKSGNAFQVGDTVLINTPGYLYHGKLGTITWIDPTLSSGLVTIQVDHAVIAGKKNHLSLSQSEILRTSQSSSDPAFDLTIRHPTDSNAMAMRDEPKNPTSLKEARMQELENKKRKLYGQAKIWHEQGRCPDCGELGRFHISAPICSEHGEY